MNLAGAAWASVAARIASTTLSFYFLFKNHGGLEAPDRVGLLRDFNPVMVIAIPAILTQLATSVVAAFAIRAMAKLTPPFLIDLLKPLYVAWFLFMIRFYLMPLILGYDVMGMLSFPLESDAALIIYDLGKIFR